jgi:hypothetical protein
MLYIVIFNPVLRVVGPFKDKTESVAWGQKWQQENGDNPCWNEIVFDGDPIAELRIEVERPN